VEKQDSGKGYERKEVKGFGLDEDENGIKDFPERMEYLGNTKVTRSGCGVLLTGSEDKNIKMF
jgi:hypothetical protein